MARIGKDLILRAHIALSEVTHAREHLDGHLAHHDRDERTCRAEQRLVDAEQGLIRVARDIAVIP